MQQTTVNFSIDFFQIKDTSNRTILTYRNLCLSKIKSKNQDQCMSLDKHSSPDENDSEYTQYQYMHLLNSLKKIFYERDITEITPHSLAKNIGQKCYK